MQGHAFKVLLQKQIIHTKITTLSGCQRKETSSFWQMHSRRSTQHIVQDMIRDLMQWIPLLPKEGGLIQMEISGHPPIPLAKNNCPLWQFPSYFSAVFRVLKFCGRFEALNDVFWRFGAKWFTSKFIWPTKVLNLRHTFPTSYQTPKSEIVCKSYDPGKLTVQLTTLGPQTL